MRCGQALERTLVEGKIFGRQMIRDSTNCPGFMSGLLFWLGTSFRLLRQYLERLSLGAAKGSESRPARLPVAGYSGRMPIALYESKHSSCPPAIGFFGLTSSGCYPVRSC
jgi:hypothetical protein